MTRTTAVSVLLAWAFLTACAETTPPPASGPPRSAAVPAVPPTYLTANACDSLAQWLLSACHDRGSDRAARTEGWCSDIEEHTLPDDRSWIVDCTRHVTDIDEACFRSTRSVRNLMDCDAAVSR
jgi:hypothetical protein